MSLQELRDTLFNYMGPIVYDHFLGPEHKSRNQQFIRFYDNPWTPNWDKDGEYVYYPVYSFTKTEIDSNAPAGQYDHILTSLLGGERASECYSNAEGPCTYNDERFNAHIHGFEEYTGTVIPALKLESGSSDPNFLGGWLLDDAPFGQHYNSLVTERDEFEVENTELQAALSEAQAAAADIKVFPFVNWTRANKSKAWYKDVDWSAIPFDHLNDDEKEKLDWSKINYKEASTNHSFDASLIDWSDISVAKESLQVKAYEAVNWDSFDLPSFGEEEKQHINSTKVDYAKIYTQLKAQDNVDFNIDSPDWSFINNLDPYLKNKLYKKVAWDKVDFKAAESSAFDWSSVNIKKAMKSDQFTLNAIDIEETKESKAFKNLKRALKKSSADDLLAGASDETLVAIGYQNLVGKIGDSLINNFTTASHNYSMILKPLSYVRASAVATAMGGSLAPQATGDSYDYELVDEIQFLVSGKQIARKLFSSQADGRSLAWFKAKSGEDSQSTYSALDLQSFDQYSGNEEIPLSSDSELWFVVDLGKRETIGESSAGLEVGPDVADLDSTPIEVIPVIDPVLPSELIPMPAIDAATAPPLLGIGI